MSGILSGTGISDLIGLSNPQVPQAESFQQALQAEQANAYHPRAASGGKIMCAAHGGKVDPECPDCLKAANADLQQKNMALAAALHKVAPKAAAGGFLGQAENAAADATPTAKQAFGKTPTTEQVFGNFNTGNPTAVKQPPQANISGTTDVLAANAKLAGQQAANIATGANVQGPQAANVTPTTAAQAGANAQDVKNAQAFNATAAPNAVAGNFQAAAGPTVSNVAGLNPDVAAALTPQAQAAQAANVAAAKQAGLQAAQTTTAAAGPQLTQGNGLAGNVNLNTGTTNQVQAQQLALANQLQQQASGQAPSLSNLQLQQANQAAIAQQAALAASQAGNNPALAARNAAVNSANLMQSNAAQAAQTAIQQQQVNQALQANVLGTTGGQAAQVAATQAGLQQQTALANAAAQAQAAGQGSAQAQQVVLANQAAQNALIQQQAGLTQQANLQTSAQAQQAGLQGSAQQAQAMLANQAATNAAAQQTSAQQNAVNLAAGQAGTQVNLANQAQANQVGLANMQTAAGLAASNAAQANQVGLANMSMQQQTALANQASNLQQQGLNNAQIASLLGIQQSDLNSILAAQTGIYASQMTGNIASQQASTSLFGGLAGLLGSLGAGITAGYSAKGGKVPGEVKHEDNYANDKVPVWTSPGEIILPVSVAQDGEKARKFVDAINAAGPKGSIESRNPQDIVTGQKNENPRLAAKGDEEAAQPHPEMDKQEDARNLMIESGGKRAAYGGATGDPYTTLSMGAPGGAQSAVDAQAYYANRGMNLANAIRQSFQVTPPPQQQSGGISPTTAMAAEKFGKWLTTPTPLHVSDITPSTQIPEAGGWAGSDVGANAAGESAAGTAAGEAAGEAGAETAGEAAATDVATDEGADALVAALAARGGKVKKKKDYDVKFANALNMMSKRGSHGR